MSEATPQPPRQLGDWVESLLVQVETRLEERNKQVEVRMNDMADRIDALESSIQGAYCAAPHTELVHGAEMGMPANPMPEK